MTSQKSIIRTRRGADAAEVLAAQSKSTKPAKTAKKTSAQITNSVMSQIEAPLSKDAIRQDFVAIVRNTEERADSFAAKFNHVSTYSCFNQ